MTKRPDLIDANRYQAMAANPKFTRLVTANAGSGKTRVLVNRVSRLLLDGADPSGILCLTYTRAAAAEMQTRLYTALGSWSIMASDNLAKEIETLGIPSQTLDLDQARRLFTRALETPEGLKVQTIHAFCERILARFPIEAGIRPGFEPLDDPEIADIKASVRRAILTEAADDPDGPINLAIQAISVLKADSTIDGLFDWMASAPGKVDRWLNSGGVGATATVLDAEQITSEAEIESAFMRALDTVGLNTFVEDLRAVGKSTDVKLADNLSDVCRLLPKDQISQAFDCLASAILTQDHSVRKTLGTADVTDATKQALQDLAHNVHEAIHAIKLARVLDHSRHIETLAARYIELYSDEKRARRGLDYSDQVDLVRDLLTRLDVSDWIRYKMDRGISHILLDEAQDTSPDQWQIIDALARPFFEDQDSDPNAPRTLFAVGDEKQSIYSFQGARPEIFGEKFRYYERLTDGLQSGGLGEVRMSMSFRSAPQVLQFVDQVFHDPDVPTPLFDPDVPRNLDYTPHTTFRTDAGQVELWPIVPKPGDAAAEAETPWDTRPVDALRESHQTVRLAREIADRIKLSVAAKTPIYDREDKALRPLGHGDILILFRSRGPLFRAVIKALKHADIPIAGADRLALVDALIVKDLLSLIRFVCLPSDSLSLAEILKSPIFGLDDVQLFDLAVDRGAESLWHAVQARAPELAKVLQSWITRAQTQTAFQFLAQILDETVGGQTVRRKFFARLGEECRDAMEEFLNQALDYQMRRAPGLHRFLSDFTARTTEIKRDLEGGGGFVRVMTVHGAKGLEAPLVILPDTTSLPRFKDQMMPVGAGWLLKPPDKDVPLKLRPYVEAAQAAVSREYMRLLYVALTRAESRLILCGAETSGKGGMPYPEGCWYDVLSGAMETVETRTFETAFDGEGMQGKIFGPDLGKVAAPEADVAPTQTDLPDWIAQPAPRAEPIRRRVTPSHLLANPPEDPPARSPASTASAAGFKRGTLIHRLLEVLPDIEPARRRDVARTMLDGQADLEPDIRAHVADEVFAVLEDPDFAHIFGIGSRAEVSLVGTAPDLPQGLWLNAQIDRLVVTQDSVTIIDYKSNRPPPKNQEDVAPIYWGQMAAYRALAAQVYPDRIVNCALLWTDGPYLMPLDASRLDDALQTIHALPNFRIS